MKIIVCGSRSFNKLAYLQIKMDRLVAKLDKTKLLILHGGQTSYNKNTRERWGADYLAGEWASRSMITCEVHHAEWDKHGKAAGPIRNSEMLKAAGKKAVCVAFWDGRSPGTKDMIGKARKAGLKVKIFTSWTKEKK